MSNKRSSQSFKLDGVEVFALSCGILGIALWGTSKALDSDVATRFFNSFDRVVTPEPYCLLKTDASGSYIEVFARSADREGRPLERTSSAMFSTDGKDTPLKDGMTGTFASKKGNTIHAQFELVKGETKMGKYTSPDEYASVTIKGWTQLDGSYGPDGTCSVESKTGTVGPVYKGMPLRLKEYNFGQSS